MFVYYLDLGLEGAIIATVIAYTFSIGILFFNVRDRIQVEFKKEYFFKWLKLSWLSLYIGRVYSMIQHFDVAIFSIITGSVFGVAYWSVSLAIGSIVAHAGSVTQGIYGKLLASDEKEYFHESFRLLLYFIIPLFAFSIIFAKPGLFTLNPIYQDAVLVVIFLSIQALFQTFTNVFYSALLGIEKVDLNEKINMKEYVKSKLFFLPSIYIIQRILHVVILVIVLLILIPTTKSQLELVIAWSIVSAIIPIPFTIYLFFMVKNYFTIRINNYSIFKYLITSTSIFSLTFLLMEEFLVYDKEIFVFLPKVLIYVFFSLGGYFSITFLIDKKTRVLFISIFSEIKSILKK